LRINNYKNIVNDVINKGIKSLNIKFPNKVFLEALIITGIISIFLLATRNILRNETVFTGDAEIWYGIYHYFSESISNWNLPLWNPYMDGGKAFWPLLGIGRLLDPVNLIFILIIKFFKVSIYHLYHINYIVTLILISLGMYLLLRYINKPAISTETDSNFFNVHFLTNILLFTFFLNYCFASDFCAPSIVNTFSWTPYILLFTLKFLDTKDVKNFLFAAYFLGILISASSYHFAFPVFFILCFISITAIINFKSIKTELPAFIKKHKFYLSLAFIYLILIYLKANVKNGFVGDVTK
jgi:hypothetical protein